MIFYYTKFQLRTYNHLTVVFREVTILLLYFYTSFIYGGS
jgi:hypothetical protein